MTKKLVCLVLAVSMLSSLFVINASAAISTAGTYADESFTRPDDQTGNAEWKPDGWTINGRHGTAALLDQGIYRVTEEGYVELCRAGYDVGACIYRVFTLPEDFTLMFDVMFPTTSGYTGVLMVDCSLNGYKQSVNVNGAITYLNESTGKDATVGAGAHADGKWYTYVYQVKGDRMSVYRKAKDESSFSLKADNVKMTTRSGNEFYAYSTSPTAYICIDNVKVFSGTYMTDASISVNDEKTTITGSMAVTGAEVAPLSDAADSVRPIMTVYDAKGRIIDMNSLSGALKFNNNNTYTVEIDLDEGVYDTLSGGTVELYLWDSLSGLTPQSAAYTMTIQ